MVAIVVILTGVVSIMGFVVMTQTSKPFNTVSSTCVGLTTLTAVMNITSTTTIQECSVTQGTLDAQGCFPLSPSADLCVRGAPANSTVSMYGNGTTIVTYPDGHVITCDPQHSNQGPCIIGAR
jgi:hypothetical protein